MQDEVDCGKRFCHRQVTDMQRKGIVRIVPELAVRDREAAAGLLARVFGFAPLSGHEDMLSLGDQWIALVPAGPSPEHGVIDHLALAVDDLDAALRLAQERGAVLEATTPDGPREIAEFWGSGVRYVFLEGPEGARIELCARLGGPPRSGLPGHDHIGIPCTDLAATEAFFLSLGLTQVAAVDLDRADGVTKVRFLTSGTDMVELYEPPALRGQPVARKGDGLWRGLRLIGATTGGGTRTGPDGLRVTLA